MKIFKSISLGICLSFLPGLLCAQQKVSGYIYSRESPKLPVTGATVRLKGNLKSSISDQNGFFQLDLLADSIIITAVGYKKTALAIPENPGDLLTIYLESTANDLGEVMVSTGYQTIAKERATGSFYKIDNTLLNQNVSTDVISRLEGISSGLLFDRRDANNTKIEIRGLSTIYSNAQPLIILDNFPYEGNINNINPNDVKDITILKDAAASSIWGARAGNGVIVITTKSGRYNSELTLSVNANTTWAEQPRLNTTAIIPSTDYIDLETLLFNKGFYNSRISSPAYNALSPVVEILANKSLSAVQAAAQIDVMRGYDVRDDFRKYIYRDALNQQYNINLSGGTDKLNYFISSGLDKNRQNLIGNELSRVNLKSSMVFRPIKNLELYADVQYTKTATTSNSPGGYGSGYKIRNSNLYPYARLADDRGNPLGLYTLFPKGFTDTLGKAKLLDWRYIPLQELKENDNTSAQHDILTNVGIKYKLSTLLNAELKYQYERSFTDSRQYKSMNTFYTRDLINRFTNLSQNQLELRNPIPMGGILDLTDADLDAYSIRGQLNARKNWADKHDINLLAGTELRQTENIQRTDRTYGYDPEFISFKNVDYINSYLSYNNLFGSNTIPVYDSFKSLRFRYVSVYANGSYTYSNRYTISASARRDASNVFGVSTNDKGTPLWSVGAAWDLSQEAFYTYSQVPYVKLRATYGRSGNTNQAVSALTTLQYYPASNSIVNLPSAQILNAANPNLKWERVAMLNLGVDFAAFKNRLSGSIEYYRKKSTDLLAFQQIDFTSGLGYVMTNSATLTGSGVDINLSGKIIDGGFKWNGSLLFSHAAYQVSKVQANSATNGYASDGTTVTPIEGYSPYELVSYRWAGLDPKTGDPLGYINGKISTDYSALINSPFSEQTKHGSGVPLYFGNLRNTFSYKNISLTLNIAYSFGYYFRKPTVNFSDLLNNGTMHLDYLRRWQKPGDEQQTNVPSFVYPSNGERDTFYQYSEINVLKGDHIRLQNVFLEYNFEQSVCKKLSIQNLSLYANSANLNLMLWRANDQGIDPNQPLGLQPGRNISLGLRFTL